MRAQEQLRRAEEQLRREKQQADEAEQLRRDAEEAQARLLAERTVGVSAFLEFENGVIEPLAGLRFYVLPESMSRDMYAEVFEALADLLDVEARELRKWASMHAARGHFMESKRAAELNDDAAAVVEDWAQELKSCAKLSELRTEQVFRLIRAGCRHQNIQYRINLDRPPLGATELEQIVADARWPGIVSNMQLAAGVADQQGRFQLGGPTGGQVVIYAMFRTGSSVIEWVVPIDFDAPGNKDLVLSNENAHIVSR